VDEAELAPRPVFFDAIYAGGARRNRSISMPANMGLEPDSRLVLGYTASNSFLNPGFLVCRDGSCRIGYETDHTGNLLFADYSRGLGARWEIGLGIGSYRMDGIPHLALPQRLASDGSLRTFHEDILRQDSLPTLSGAPDGRQAFALEDLAGRELVLEPRRTYLLPFRLRLTRYVELRRTRRIAMGINIGLHLAYPLEGDPGPGEGETAFARGADVGISANFVRSRHLTANLASTFHIQLARFRSDVHVVNPRSPLAGDDTSRSQYALTWGLRFGNTFSGRAPCSFAIGQITVSAAYDKETYWAWDPVVFSGGNNLRGALAGANDYGVANFACEYRLRRFQLALVEDIAGLSQIIDDDGAGTSYDPDLAVSVSVSWSPGRRRRDSAD
jgi:hypothetical protein